jgi:hypothetical protein
MIFAFAALSIIFAIFSNLEKQKVVVLQRQISNALEDAAQNPRTEPWDYDNQDIKKNAIILNKITLFKGSYFSKKALADTISLSENCLSLSAPSGSAFSILGNGDIDTTANITTNIYFYCQLSNSQLSNTQVCPRLFCNIDIRLV